MSLDNALFLVQRGETNYHSKGSDIGDRMATGDTVLVQRGTNHFKATYTGSWDKIQDSDLVLAWDGTNNRKVTGANFKTLFVQLDPEVEITRWDYGYAGTWYPYASPLIINWQTRHAKDFEINGNHQYAVYSGEYAGSTYETYRYPSKDQAFEITGTAFSKYDDSTVDAVATVNVRGISIAPGYLSDTVDNIKPGLKMRPKFNMTNVYTLEQKGAKIMTTWDLVGMTKGNEEASFAMDSVVDHYFDEFSTSPPTIHRRAKTRNGPITLRAEGVNGHNYERVRDEHQFTCSTG